MTSEVGSDFMVLISMEDHILTFENFQDRMILDHRTYCLHILDHITLVDHTSHLDP